MSQTAYSIEATRAFAGLLGDSKECDIFSRGNEEASDLPFGIAVVPGTTPTEEFALATATGFTLLGVLAHRQNTDVGNLTGVTGVEASGGIADVVRKGRVWVLAEETITPFTSSVYIRHTADGVWTQVGTFRTDADTAEADDHSAVAQYVDYIAVSGLSYGCVGLALVDLNLPGS